MSFNKFIQTFSSGNIFLIPIDDEYDNHNNHSFPSYTKTKSHFDFSNESSPSNSNLSFHSSPEICETKKLQTQNIFRGNLSQIIYNLKNKTKEDYINLLIKNYHKENKILYSNFEHRS